LRSELSTDLVKSCIVKQGMGCWQVAKAKHTRSSVRPGQPPVPGSDDGLSLLCGSYLLQSRPILYQCSNGKVFDDNRSATSVRVLVYIKRVKSCIPRGLVKSDSVDDVIRGTTLEPATS
jgi:hypothetical protein